MQWFEDEQRQKAKQEKDEIQTEPLTEYTDFLHAFTLLQEKYQILVDDSGRVIAPLMEELDGASEKERGLIDDLFDQFRFHSEISRMRIGQRMIEVLKKTRTLKEYKDQYNKQLLQCIDSNGFIYLIESAIEIVKLRDTEIQENRDKITQLTKENAELAAQGPVRGRMKYGDNVTETRPEPQKYERPEISIIEKAQIDDRINQYWPEFVKYLRSKNLAKANTAKLHIFQVVAKNSRNYEVRRAYLEEQFNKRYNMTFGNPDETKNFNQRLKVTRKIDEENALLEPEYPSKQPVEGYSGDSLPNDSVPPGIEEKADEDSDTTIEKKK